MRTPQPLKIRKLVITGFRGALRPLELDFTSSAHSTLLYGENGTGKSTISDALEWFFTSQVHALDREGCRESAYRHRRLAPDELATVSFHADRNFGQGSRHLPANRKHHLECSHPEMEGWIGNAARDTLFLNALLMRDFVDKSKTDKLNYIAQMLGLERLTAMRHVFLSTFNALKKHPDSRDSDTEIKRYEAQIRTAMGTKRFGDETAVFSFADAERRQLQGEIPITDAVSFRESVNDLRAFLPQENSDAILARIEAQRTQIQKAWDFEGLYADWAALQTETDQFLQDKDAVDQIALEKLYRVGHDILERQRQQRMVNPNPLAMIDVHCPLCQQPVQEAHLLRHLSETLERIQRVQSQQRDLQLKRDRLKARLHEWEIWLAEMGATLWDAPGADAARLADELKTWVDLLRPQAAAQAVWLGGANYLQSLPPLPSDFSTFIACLFACCHQLETFLVTRRDMVLSGDDTERQAGIHRLERILSDFMARDAALQRKSHIARQISTLEVIKTKFEQMEADILTTVLDTISADVNRFYTLLHPNEGFDAVSLHPTENRGLEFHFSYHGEPISPPAQLLSESHLNTLGVCLFLAAARHFNRYTRFLILDDVVNSVDANHRQAMARLLRDEFGDFQILLLTHDRIWFDMLKKLVTWDSKELSNWEYGSGIQLRESVKKLEDQARDHLRNGAINDAGNSARRAAEGLIKELCEKLSVPLPYKANEENDRRLLNELLSHFKGFLGKSDLYRQNTSLFRDLESSQFVVNSLSHDNTYTTAPPTASDINLFLADLMKLEALFRCPDCNKIAPKNKSCDCGHHSWK